LSSKNKRRLSKAERDRREEARETQRRAAVVEDTVSLLGCPVAVARDMVEQCIDRHGSIDVDLTYACLAHEVWSAHADSPVAADLVSLLSAFVAEQLRHARALLDLERRLQPLLHNDHAHHVHLADGVVDPAYVARMIYTPPEDQPIRKALEASQLSPAVATPSADGCPPHNPGSPNTAPGPPAAPRGQLSSD
jgi:hypothetical protein